MSNQWPSMPSGDPWNSVAWLIGATGFGAAALKTIEKLFVRKDDVAAGLRGEMTRRILALETNQKVIEDKCALLEQKERDSFEIRVRYEAESRQLRIRHHAFLNWLAQTPGLPDPPEWLYDPIDGPTKDVVPAPSRAKPPTSPASPPTVPPNQQAGENIERRRSGNQPRPPRVPKPRNLPDSRDIGG